MWVLRGYCFLRLNARCRHYPLAHPPTVQRIDINREDGVVVVTLEDGAVVPGLRDDPSQFKYIITIGAAETFERQLADAQAEMGLEERDYVSVR